MLALSTDEDRLAIEARELFWLPSGGTLESELDHKAIAGYLRSNTHKTIVGSIKFAADGEWEKTGTVQAQFRGVKDKDIEQFRGPGKQVILSPADRKTGEPIIPFEKARKG